jgi:hypothetical protein
MVAPERWMPSEPYANVCSSMAYDIARVINHFRTKLPSGRVAEYSYVRYFFTNCSSNIRRIFCEHGELPGIRVTQ